MRALVVTAVFIAALCHGTALETTTNVFESAVPPKPDIAIDKIIFSRLEKLGEHPVLCCDAVFVRRAYLDLLGTIPTAREARDFIVDTDAASKRQRLVERLLQRDEFADYWAMKWGDILRIKAEFPVNLWPNAAQAYHRWIRASIAENKPYDKFVREMLTASGSNFRVGQVNFYRAIQNRTPEGIARAVALAFMGTRAESWPSNRLENMTRFFSQVGYKPTAEWKEEHVYWDPLGASAAKERSAPGRADIAEIEQPLRTVPTTPNRPLPVASAAAGVFPDGKKVSLPPDRDPREVFADWLITPENPWFTRSIVNRVWAWTMGRGIIHEPDDIRDDNPPSEPELLVVLEKEFVASGYNLKRLYQLIVSSQAYQLSSGPDAGTNDAKGAFARYALRRLDAEVLSDAINKITGSSELYTSPIPEPYTYIPKGMSAVSIADGSITSPFLALFGRSARSTGLESERHNQPTPGQWLYLLNSTDVQRKLEQSANLQAIVGFGRKPASAIADELYLTILSRYPTAEERRAVEAYSRPPKPKPASTNSAPTNVTAKASVGTNTSRASSNVVGRPGPLGSLGPATRPSEAGVKAKTRDDWIDVAWALINSDEFLYRH